MTTKNCCNCKQDLNEEEFYWKDKIKESRQAQCKQCFNAYVKVRWHKRKVEAIKYKGGVCIDCNQMPHPGCMQFHHLDPSEKEFSWNKGRLRAWEAVKRELDKCVLLCANCHAIRHSNYTIDW